MRRHAPTAPRLKTTKMRNQKDMKRRAEIK